MKNRSSRRMLRNLKAGEKPFDVRDTVVQGFGVRRLQIGAQGVFSDAQNWGRRRWKMLGCAAEVSVAEARKRAAGKT